MVKLVLVAEVRLGLVADSVYPLPAVAYAEIAEGCDAILRPGRKCSCKATAAHQGKSDGIGRSRYDISAVVFYHHLDSG